MNSTDPNPLATVRQQFSQSYRLALKSYEQIALMFFLPTLVYILALTFIGSVNVAHLSINGHQMIGVYLIVVWALLSLINFPATMYLRVKVVKGKNVPSLIECYKNGYKNTFNVYLSAIFSYFLILIGLVLLIIPGLYMIKRYILAPYYAADNPKMSFKQAMAKSARQSAPYAQYLYMTFIFIIVFQLITNLVFGGSVIGEIAFYLINYSILYLLPLRYLEISKSK